MKKRKNKKTKVYRNNNFIINYYFCNYDIKFNI